MNSLWRGAVAAAMVLLIFEGALRKWVLPEAQAWLYLAKDALLLLAYAGFVMARGLVVPPGSTPILVLVFAGAIYGASQVLNPALPNLSLALIGWKSYFWYVPLLIVVPYLFRSSQEMADWLRRYALIAVPVAFLGVLQFFSPTDSAINLNVEHELGMGAPVTFGEIDRVRAAGTFSFISGYTAYLTAIALLCVALAAAKRWRLEGNRALLVALAMTLVAMLASGSRAPIFTMAVAVPAYLLVSSLRGDLSLGAALRATAAISIGALLIWYLAPQPFEAFAARASRSDDAISRLVGPLEEPFRMLEHAGFWGFGIGATHQASSYLVGTRFPWWTGGLWAEAETTRVMMELGPIGFVLMYSVRIVLFAMALRAAFTLKAPAHRALALALALFFALHVPGAVIFNVTAGVYYWFAAGLLFALFRLEQATEQGASRSASARTGVALRSFQ